LRTTPGSARGRRLGLVVGASSWRPRATAPDSTTTASWNGVERLVATNARRTLTTGCLVSSASTVQLRFTATTVDSSWRTTSDDSWTPEVVTPLRHTASINSTVTRQQKINRMSVYVDRYVQNCFRNARFPSTAELNPRLAHVGQLDRHTHKGVKNSAKQSRPAAYTGASCRCNVAKTIGTKIDDLE